MKYRSPERNPGDYYHNKRVMQELWLRCLEEAERLGIEGHWPSFFRNRLEEARYTGD